MGRAVPWQGQADHGRSLPGAPPEWPAKHAVKALVTGGAGFIGCNLVRLLHERSYQVTVLDDLSGGLERNLADIPQTEFIQGDVRDPRALDQAMAGNKVVFHLAALSGGQQSLDNPVDDSSVNFLGTLEVLQAARRHSVDRVIYSSTAGVFGERYFVRQKIKRISQSRSRFPSLEIMAKELDLRKDQQTQIRKLFRENEEKFKKLRHQMNRELGEMRKLLLEDIKNVLDQEQKQAFDAMLKKYAEQRKQQSEQRSRYRREGPDKRSRAKDKGDER